MKKKLFLFQVLMSTIIAFQCDAQSPGLDQILKGGKANADAIKKNSPPSQQKQKNELPPGYDNSWKVMVTLSRTVTSSTNLTSTVTKCIETKIASLNYILQASFSTNKSIGWLNGDDFSLMTDVDANLKPFRNPFKGSYIVNSDAKGENKSCGDRTISSYTANCSIDPSQIDVIFQYNKKEKQGSFSVQIPSDYSIDASGKSTAYTKNNPPVTADVSEYGKVQTQLLTSLCGNFSAWNYAVSKDANTEKTLTGSPLIGALASIGETKHGYEIDCSQSKTVNDPVPDFYKGSIQTTYVTSVHISITDQDPIEYDAILVTVPIQTQKGSGNYDRWLPEGPSDNQPGNDKGNLLAFRIMLVDKKNPAKEDPGMDYDVQYDLLPNSVSKEKGYCINYPQQTSDDDEPDLRFDMQLMKSEKVTVTENQVKSADFGGRNVIAILTSYDYGSYAKMKVLVTLKEGFPIYAHFQNDKKTEISIPKDNNNNHIADYWEDTTGILGKNYEALWDKETQQGNSNDGDGLSLYEEYRGVFSQGKHIRLNPNKKELFVINQIGDPIKPGLQAMEKAASIHIVELKKEETDNDKIVNFNSSKFQNGRQSAVSCVKHDFIKNFDENDKKNGVNQDNNVFGVAIAKNFSPSNEPLINSPKDCLEYRLNGNRINETENVKKNVAHELGHTCGLLHHGDNVPDLKFSKILHQASSYDSVYIYFPDGNLVYKAPAKNLAASIYLPFDSDDMGVPNCSASGHVRCFMTYNEDFEYLYKELKNPDNTIYKFTMTPFGAKQHKIKSFDSSQYLYCSSADGTEWNQGNKLFGNADAGRGNCMGQFKIKDY